MKIAIDMQATAGQATGFGRYVSQITKSLKLVAPPDISFLEINKVKKNLRTPTRIIWDQIGLPLTAAVKHPDLLFVPAFSAPLIWPGKMIVTCHDLIGSLFPENFSRSAKLYWHDLLPYSLKRADQIITISESTKKDIIRLTGISEVKIAVIPLATDEIFKPCEDLQLVDKVKKTFQLNKPYCLAVGTIEPRKNLPFLVEAFAHAKSADYDLVIVGKKGWDMGKLYQTIQQSHLRDRVKILEYVPESDLPILYSAATALLFPSLYEGFGLPILEAMACGTPVIASTASSIPEVGGEAILYADPKDSLAWSDNISQILNDRTKRQNLRALGLKRAQQFSWERTARATLKLFINTGKNSI